MEKIKQLREKTGAGMIECKKALDESQGDIEKAVEILRKKGGLKAAKKADRATNEGVIKTATSTDNKKISLVKVLCETDFVARNEDFNAITQEIADAGLAGSSEDFFNAKKDEIVLKVGENITLGEDIVEEGEFISSYIHSNSKLASVVIFNKALDVNLATDIAMHATAMAPTYLNPEDVVANEVEKEKDIYREQLKKEGKPEEIIDKILIGKINKYYEDVCLVKQSFIKDDKKSVEQVLAEVDADLKIVKFIRISL